MVSALFRQPEDDEQGEWFTATEVLEILQQRYGKSTLKNISPEQIGSTLASRQFNFQTAHKRKGNCYRMVKI